MYDEIRRQANDTQAIHNEAMPQLRDAMNQLFEQEGREADEKRAAVGSVSPGMGNAIYRWLTNKELNGWNDKKPKWNFYKYLMNEKGELINFFSETVSPFDDAILNKL